MNSEQTNTEPQARDGNVEVEQPVAPEGSETAEAGSLKAAQPFHRKSLFWWKLGVVPIAIVISCCLSLLYLFTCSWINEARWSKMPFALLVGQDGTVFALRTRYEYRRDLDLKNETHRTKFFSAFKQTVPRIYDAAGNFIELAPVKDEEAKDNKMRFGLKKDHPKYFYYLLEKRIEPVPPNAQAIAASVSMLGMPMTASNTGGSFFIPDENVSVPYSPVVWEVAVAQTAKTSKTGMDKNNNTAEAFKEIFCVYEWPLKKKTKP